MPTSRAPDVCRREWSGRVADYNQSHSATEHGPPTEYLPCVGQIDLPGDDTADSDLRVEVERAAAAACPQPDPNLDFLARVLRGLRKL
jgi:hypothetical protein